MSDSSQRGITVTVVIPTYHRNDLLARCLERLAPGAQSIPKDQYRVIVTDDGTNSGAQEMMRDRFPWAEWTQGPREGRSANRNHAVSLAKTRWIAFTDDDCVPDPKWLESFLGAIEDDVTVYEGRTTCEGGISSPALEAPLNLTGGALWSCNMMIAKETFDAFGGFDRTFAKYGNEDTDLNLRLRKAGHVVKFVPEATIDHPARPRPRGRRAVEQYESIVHVWYKSGNTGRILPRLVRHAASVELRYLARFRPSWETVVGLVSLGSLLMHLTRFGGGWERTYRERYAGREGAYSFPFW